MAKGGAEYGDEPEKVESATTGKGKKKAAKEEAVEP